MKAQVIIESGRTTVTIEGQVLQVRDLQVMPSVELGIAPQLIVRLPTDQSIDFDGVVYVERDPSDEQVMAAAADWVASVDRDVLISLVQSRLITMSDNPITKTLDVITELIRADHG